MKQSPKKTRNLVLNCLKRREKWQTLTLNKLGSLTADLDESLIDPAIGKRKLLKLDLSS